MSNNNAIVKTVLPQNGHTSISLLKRIQFFMRFHADCKMLRISTILGDTVGPKADARL